MLQCTQTCTLTVFDRVGCCGAPNNPQGGVAAMELVAMELKHAGCYIARTLSYEVRRLTGFRG